MRFKYYLKGLGMGIIVTTIVMSISCVMHNNNLTDQEIIDKAIELGMVMPESEKDSGNGLFGSGDKETSETEDSDSEGEPQSGSEIEPSETETQLPDNSELPTDSELLTDSELPTENVSPSEPDTEKEPQEPVTQEPPQHVEIKKYVLHIVWGDYPRKIANELYENGMIDDAKKFRNYLGDYCKQHNKEIRVGTYTITKGMTYEEIAKKITKS